ncbi:MULTISPECIES: hypothetical protein [Streptomycetaceae]|uniref:hypothetical protein n=1 Tax=Streptomycetaceae TaxID=2062 RepID=UPI000213F5F1|nr:MULTISPECIES: hypothetical protein [Streptomycetaceae]MYS58757.1 hypothetical protein [Streptomyces sp. SID5468]CCB74442.1 protein of unknown function [Streptantibioticus cattleyicolor NRRL 8057 = DSM 46488]
MARGKRTDTVRAVEQRAAKLGDGKATPEANQAAALNGALMRGVPDDLRREHHRDGVQTRQVDRNSGKG